MELAELVERFSLDRINRKPAVFDHDKLEWLNGQYLARLSGTELVERARPLLAVSETPGAEALERRHDWLIEVFEALKSRARTLRDLVERARPFFPGPVALEPEAAAKHWKDRPVVGAQLRRLHAVLSQLESWDEESLEHALRSLAEELDVGAGKLIHPLRVALTGSAVSPGIFEVMNLMGRELVLARIDAAISHLRGA